MGKIKDKALWLEFYKTAGEFRQLAPWGWMNDSDVFGIQNPDTGEVGWCSIMGNAGEHFALGIYKGAKGMVSYWRLHEAGSNSAGEMNFETLNAMFGQECWMVSFENVGTVQPEQRAILKELGIKFSGSRQWIVVEDYANGYLPWPVDEADLPFLIACLQQAMDVARRYRTDRKLLRKKKAHFLYRRFDGGAWVDDQAHEDSPLYDAPEIAPLEPTDKQMERLMNLPTKPKTALVAVTFLSPMPIQEKKTVRPWRSLIMLGMDQVGTIVFQNMVKPGKLERELPEFIVKLCEKAGFRPERVLFSENEKGALMRDILKLAKIDGFVLPPDDPNLGELARVFLRMGR